MRTQLTTRQIYTALAIIMVIVMAVGGSGLLSPPDQPAGPASEADSTNGDLSSPPTFTPSTGTPQVTLASTYLHPSGYFQIAPPFGWALNESTEAGVVSANWVGSREMAVLHALVLLYDQPFTRDEFISRVEADFSGGFSNYDSYTVVNRNYDGDPIVVDFALSFGGQSYIAREWASAVESVISVLRVVVPAGNPALLALLEERVLPTFRVFPDARPAPAGWEAFADPERWYTFKHPAGWANLGTGQDGARRFADAQSGWQAEMAILVQPGTSVRSEEGARAWLEALQPGAEISTVEPVERAHGAGYMVSFVYPAGEGRSRRGLLLLLNANDAVYRVDLRLPAGADDPLNEEARRRADAAISILETFNPLPAEGAIPTPMLGGAPSATATAAPANP